MRMNINIDKSKHYNDYQLFSAIIFLVQDVFSEYTKLNFTFILQLTDEVDEEITSHGFTCVCDGNEIIINIFLHNIIESNKKDPDFKSLKKNIFHIILHEIGHAIEAVKRWNGNKEKTLEETFDNNIDERKSYQKIPKGYKREMMWLRDKEEIICERFAFKNLSYLETLYEFKGCLCNDLSIKGLRYQRRTRNKKIITKRERTVKNALPSKQPTRI